MTQRHPNIPPMHPGELLREVVMPALKADHDITQQTLADALGTSRNSLQDILHERRAVTAEMAVRLGKVLGNGADLWLNLQKTYDLWQAERDVDISKIKTIRGAA